MSPTRNLMIATIIFSQVLSNAITISTNLQAENQLINIDAYSYMIPVHVEDQSVIGATRMEMSHPFLLQAVGASLHAKYAYSELFSIYGELGANFPTEKEKLFAQGSLLIQPYISPTLSIGASYETQSGSMLEIGANLTHFMFDLQNKSDGGLFNGYPESLETDLSANMVDISIGISIPVVNKFSAFINMHYGMDIFETELPIDNNIPVRDRSALLEYQGNTTPRLGNLFDENMKFTCTKVSIGTRFNVTEVYN